MRSFDDTTPTPKSYSDPARLLVDSQGRQITYLRLAITDRCNLRCTYCRPEQGVPFIPHEEILSLEEMERLVSLFCSMGVTKVRVTGGEPFSRKGCISFMHRLRQIRGLDSLYITTNGVKTGRFLDELKSIPIDGLNLSLDTMDPARFSKITRRDYLASVLDTLHGALQRKIRLKVNSVVLPDTTDEEMMSLARLAKQHPLTLRYIETMPFSGTVRADKLVNGNLVSRLYRIFPGLEEAGRIMPTTARVYTVPGYTGRLGIIQGHTRQFCATCNKLRITPTGMLKTCLYDNGALDLKALLRSGAGDLEICGAVTACVQNRFVNGYEAEKYSTRAEQEPSMGMIGG